MNLSKWDIRFLDAARFFSMWSKDPSTKVGAVIVDNKNRIIGSGFNGFPRGVDDTVERLANKPTKYAMIVHAEVNAILNAVANVDGATIYCTHGPCAECAKVIIQAGIRRVVSPFGNLTGWETQQETARTMFSEAGVQIG